MEATRRIVANYPPTLPAELTARIRATETEFRKGRVDLLTFLETEDQLSQTTQRALDLQISYAAKIAELFSLSGDPVLPDRIGEF